MTHPIPLNVFSSIASTTFIMPRAGARLLRVEKAKPRAALPKTGQFGLCAEPRPAAQKITLRLSPPPSPANLYVQTPKGLARSEAFEDWLEHAATRLATQRKSPAAFRRPMRWTSPRRAPPAPGNSAQWSGRWSNYWRAVVSFRAV